MPGLPLPTPAVHEPSSFTQWPCSKLLESSPMYQTLPCLSWAYQSNVRSSGLPREKTWSRTTVASMPMMRFFRWVTKTVFSSRVLPSSPTPR